MIRLVIKNGYCIPSDSSELLIASLPLILRFCEIQSSRISGRVSAFLFVMQERGKEGLGMQGTRPLADEPLCTQTTGRYWMWAGEAENATVCSCAGEGLVCGGE